MQKFQVVILFLFLISCSSNQAVSSTPIQEILPASNPSPTEATVPSTQTLTPTSTSVPIVSSAPTWTPFPTLSLTDGMRILPILIIGNLDCLLPCWGGVTPGKTNWQEAKQLLQPLSGFASIKVVENINCDFGPCNGIGWSLFPDTLAEGRFYTKSPGDMIHLINIDMRNEGSNKTNYGKNIKMRDVFEFYGFPALLLFSADLNSSKDRFLEITLVYPKRQFIITYWKKATLAGDKAVSCGQYYRVRVIILDNQDQLMSLDAISQAVETKDLNLNIQHKSAREALGMTNGAFYAIYSEKTEPCISTPINIWAP